MRTHKVVLFARREIAEALRARWFMAYAGIFLVAGLVFAAFGMGESVVQGYRGFARAFAGLVHLALLFVPLMALLPAASTVAGERETGVLEYLLAQPVTSGEVYAGKWSGIAAAVLLALTIGFGFAGGVAVFQGVPTLLVVTLFGYVVLLALAFVGTGLFVSSLADSRTRALTTSLMLWLVLIALGTLGLMITFIRWGLPQWTLVTWTFVNPIEAFRIGIMAVLDPDLSLLGPVGAGIVERIGNGGTAAAAAATLAAWAVIPGAAGWWRFRAGRASAAA